MIDDLKEKLKAKGWSDQEIDQASSIMQGFESQRRARAIKESPLVYWTALLVAIIGNIILSVVLIPFMIVLKGPILYLMVAVLALMFGTLFNILLRDIESIDREHHVIASVFIPALALVNIYVVVSITGPIKTFLTGSPLVDNPWGLSIVYVVAFVLPYILNKIYDILRRKQLKG